MLDDELDLRRLKRQIRDVLEASKDKINITTNDDGGTYEISTKEAVFKIRISKNWIGYELEVKKEVLGKRVGTFVDTDNYSLGGDNKQISLQIFNELIACLRGLVENRIFIGREDGKIVLAIPLPNKKYKLRKSGRFLATRVIVDEAEIKAKSCLRPLV